MQLAERALVPGSGLFDFNDVAHWCGRCCQHPTMLDRDWCRVDRRLEEVTQ
jgi:hypothetical protein